MKDKKNNIDQLFSENLSSDRNYQIPDKFTDDLNSRLAQRKSAKSKKGLWIFSSIILLAIISTSIFYFRPSSETDNISQSTVDSGNLNIDETSTLNNQDNLNALSQESGATLNEDDASATIAEDNTEIEQKEETDKQYNSKSTVDVSLGRKETGTNELKKDDQQVLINNNPKLKSDIGDASSDPNKNVLDTGDRDNKTNTNQNLSDKKSSDSGVGSNLEELENDEKKPESSLGLNEMGDNEIETLPDSSDLEHKNEDALNVSSELSSDSTNSPNEVVETSNQSENGSIDSTKNADIDGTDSLATTNPEIEINTEPSPKKVSFELQGFGGFDIISAKMIHAAQIDQDAYNSSNLRKLSAIYGFAGQVNYNQLFASVGLSMYKFVDESNYTTLDYSSITVDSVTTTFLLDSISYDSMGMPADSFYITQLDTTSYTIDDSTIVNNNVTNTYKIMSIPLSFGYTFNYKHWAFRPRLSAIFELTRQSIIGNYPISSNNNLLDQMQSIRFGMSMGIDIQIQRNFGGLYAFVRPGYRMRLSNTASNASSSIKHHSFNTVFGVGYTFGK